MKANHLTMRGAMAIVACGAAAMVSSCAAPPKPAAPVVVKVPPPPAPAPLPKPLPRPAADWRDAAQSPGEWHWAVIGGRSTASYGTLGGAVSASITCDKAGNQILLARSGTGSEVHTAMAVSTSTGTRPLVSEPVLSRPGWLVVSLNPRDPVLDAIAFSRGRFAFDAAGAPVLILPSWPEISRVIEDCR